MFFLLLAQKKEPKKRAAKSNDKKLFAGKYLRPRFGGPSFQLKRFTLDFADFFSASLQLAPQTCGVKPFVVFVGIGLYLYITTTNGSPPPFPHRVSQEMDALSLGIFDVIPRRVLRLPRRE
jgi:hypothetical protein